MFTEEAEKLDLIFGKEIVDIYHIGSTSVPGLKAKPIIDIMPFVKDINMVDHYNEQMMKIGYEPKGEEWNTWTKILSKRRRQSLSPRTYLSAWKW